jgi:hypothetical protein
MTFADVETRASKGDVRAQVDLAARLDEAGRYAEAVDWLARASRAGDPEALTRLGLKLVTGANAPFIPAEGAKLLYQASEAGGAGAADRLAVLAGMGFALQQSWDGAFDWLQRAAELGSDDALEQLRILSGDAAGTVVSMRRKIDIAAWTSPSRATVLHDSPRIRLMPGLISPQACGWVIRQSRGRLVRAEVYDPVTGANVPSEETRFNRIANFGLAETNLLNLLIQARLAAAVGVPLNRLEGFAVLHYEVGEEYGEHYDFLDPAIPACAAEIARFGQRIATCLLYLNEDYEGGTTDFPQLGVCNKGRTGDVLEFHSVLPSGAPDTRSVHAGRSPTRGEKWLLTQFIRDRAVIGTGGG